MKKQRLKKSQKLKARRATQPVWQLVIKQLFSFILFILVLVLVSYFFVVPSIISNDVKAKNIVIVSSRLDVRSKFIYLAHITGSEEQNSVFVIPAEELVSVPNGYGDYSLSSVFNLLKIDKKDDNFIKASFSELLGVTIDEVVTVDELLDKDTSSNLASFFLLDSIKSLTKLKLHSVYTSLYLHYKFKSLELIDLDSYQELQDNRELLFTLDEQVYQYCSVAVVNASNSNGLAKKKASIIENTGALVVRVDDLEEKSQQTKIYFANQPVDCQPLAERITNLFYQKAETLPLEKLSNAQQYRAKVVVIIGR